MHCNSNIPTFPRRTSAGTVVGRIQFCRVPALSLKRFPVSDCLLCPPHANAYIPIVMICLRNALLVLGICLLASFCHVSEGKGRQATVVNYVPFSNSTPFYSTSSAMSTCSPIFASHSYWIYSALVTFCGVN